MASTLLSPPVAPTPRKETAVSCNNGNGFGGGDIDFPHDGRRWESDPDPERWATPLSAYRAAGLFIVFSIMSVFATVTHILESRWVHSKDWVPIDLPHILYVNSAVLLVSSLTVEIARFWVNRENSKRSAQWLVASLLLGLAFLGGQVVAWRELVDRGLYMASNPGSFFFYFLTATHGVHLLGGIVAFAYVILFARRLTQKKRQKTAVGVVAFYWHFMDGLWIYLFVLLLTTIQR